MNETSVKITPRYIAMEKPAVYSGGFAKQFSWIYYIEPASIFIFIYVCCSNDNKEILNLGAIFKHIVGAVMQTCM